MPFFPPTATENAVQRASIARHFQCVHDLNGALAIRRALQLPIVSGEGGQTALAADRRSGDHRREEAVRTEPAEQRHLHNFDLLSDQHVRR